MNELKLITDRTAENAAIIAELWQIPWQQMNQEQKALWVENLKGAYNFADLNRVESGVELVGEALWRLPYELKAVAAENGVAWDKFFSVPYNEAEMKRETKTDWAENDLVSAEQMSRYLANVAAIKNALPISAPALPRSMDNLTWQGANAIEAAILAASEAASKRFNETTQMIKNTAKGWIFSGEIFGGE